MMIAVAFIMVFGTTVVMAQADEPVVSPSRLETSHAYMYKHTEMKRIGMEAVIAELDDLGLDTTELSSILSEAVTLRDSLESAVPANNWTTYAATVDQLKALYSQFKERSHDLISTIDCGNDIDCIIEPQIRLRIREAEQGNATYLQSLNSTASQLRINHLTAVYDKWVSTAQNLIDRAEERGMNVSALQVGLDTIVSARSGFVANITDAVASNGFFTIGAVVSETRQQFNEVRREFRTEVVNRIQQARENAQAEIQSRNTIRERANQSSTAETIENEQQSEGEDSLDDSANNSVNGQQQNNEVNGGMGS